MYLAVLYAAVISLGAVFLTALCCYLWLLAGLIFIKRRLETQRVHAAQTRFVFVVPAHNEEAEIASTIQSLHSVDYPAELFSVLVVADNCTDETSAVALREGARCLVRTDDNLRGKGYALKCAFDAIAADDFDMAIVIDADSVVSKNFLAGLAERFRAGQHVVQAYDGLSNPDATVLTYLFQVGNLIENRLFWEQKERLGLPILLRGNGMCFSREILATYPWDSFSIVEDTEYGLQLLEKGVRVRFAREIGVFARQPENLQQAYGQRVRWASGNAVLTRGRAVHYLLKGLSTTDWLVFDLGVTMLVGSKPLLLVGNVLLLLLAFFSGTVQVVWLSVLLCGQIAYVVVGILLNGLSWKKLRFLTLAPLFLLWLCVIALLGLTGFKRSEWVRTARL